MPQDYYEILGVPKDATKEDIKRAFRKLAQKYHPDKSGGDEAQFKKINEAYQILSDDRKRAEYDAYGNAYQNGSGFGGFDPSQFSGFGGFDFSGANGVNIDLDDLFGEFFGGRKSSKVNRGRDIAIDIELSFKESIFGTERKVLLTKQTACTYCGGNGAEPGSSAESCATCAGKGTIRELRKSFLGTISTNRICDDCQGRGQKFKKSCGDCRGLGVVRGQEEIVVAIPSGIEDGEMIRMVGRGEASPFGQSGDLYIKVRVEKHPKFGRDGHNILHDLHIKITDAILGSRYVVETLDGPADIVVPAGTSHGNLIRIKERGVPLRNGKRGDLIVKVFVDTPQKISKQAKEYLEKLREEGI